MNQKIKTPFQFKLPLKIVIIIPAVLGLGGSIYILINEDIGIIFYTAAFITLLYLGTWIYILLRLFRFNRRLKNYLRRLLSGDYSTGIMDIKRISDEITLQTDLATRVAQTLESYDQLRADRTGMSIRALDTLFRRASRKIIMADMDKAIFKFTKPLQEAFGVDQDSFNFSAIEKRGKNTLFFHQFMIAALKDTQIKEFSATLELPIRESALDLNFTFVPIKDKSEKVRIAFLYADFSENDPVD